jgi:hypothetical protein
MGLAPSRITVLKSVKPMLLLALLFLLQQVPAGPAPVSAHASARVWEGRNAEFEAYLRAAPVSRVATLDLGVTHPKRLFFASGGLAASAAWKPLRPGYKNGYWESYKSEVAAYELDKYLDLGMVPVVVERKIDGAVGAVVLWLEGVRTWSEVLPLTKPATWSRQLARMKLFDDLIGNSDRNKGNLLVDEAWNLYLIDHSRAFLDDRALPQTIDHVDSALWARIEALDETTLLTAAGTWLTKSQIKSILARRDKMAAAIAALVKKNGRAAVFAW